MTDREMLLAIKAAIEWPATQEDCIEACRTIADVFFAGPDLTCEDYGTAAPQLEITGGDGVDVSVDASGSITAVLSETLKARLAHLEAIEAAQREADTTDREILTLVMAWVRDTDKRLLGLAGSTDVERCVVMAAGYGAITRILPNIREPNPSRRSLTPDIEDIPDEGCAVYQDATNAMGFSVCVNQHVAKRLAHLDAIESAMGKVDDIGLTLPIRSMELSRSRNGDLRCFLSELINLIRQGMKT